MIFLLVVIFHSCVKLPEANSLVVLSSTRNLTILWMEEILQQLGPIGFPMKHWDNSGIIIGQTAHLPTGFQDFATIPQVSHRFSHPSCHRGCHTSLIQSVAFFSVSTKQSLSHSAIHGAGMNIECGSWHRS